MREDIKLRKAKVIDQKKIAPNTFVLSLERIGGFKAGQVVAITINEQIPPRIYSIASGEHDGSMDILYDVKEKGVLTPKLAELNSGDQVLMSQPYGSFISDLNPGWWIATGTGIAPFVSMVKSGYAINKKLIHGAKTEASFYYSGLLTNELGDRYIRCCSQCQSDENYAGRLTKYLSEQRHLPVNQKYYLCGVPEMVVDVRDILISRKIPYQQIMAEIYF